MKEKKICLVYDNLSEKFIYSGTLEECRAMILKSNNPFLELAI